MRHYSKAINSLVPVLLAALVLVGCVDIEKPKEVSLAMLRAGVSGPEGSHLQPLVEPGVSVSTQRAPSDPTLNPSVTPQCGNNPGWRLANLRSQR